MPSLSNVNLSRADVAEIAQLLRVGDVFGSVAFHEKASFTAEVVRVQPGYEDCLPIRGGGRWRDPVSPTTTELLK